MSHIPVLYDEALAALNVRAGGYYLDATFGRGGHGRGIFEALREDGRLLAMDKDPEAARSAEAQFGADSRFSFYKGSFTRMDRFLADEGVAGRMDGVLMDLGVSSPQLDSPERGFSFRQDGPLDMRMDNSAGETAAGWVNRVKEREIGQALKFYGEERFARRIARAIVQYRTERKIRSTGELADIIRSAVPKRELHKDPATRSFQALRIVVNQELDGLTAGLELAVDALTPGGRLVVISFHSLEDRLVKRFMRDRSRPALLPKNMPMPADAFQPRLRVIGKPARASNTEVRRNPRARSAIMRVAEKVQ